MNPVSWVCQVLYQEEWDADRLERKLLDACRLMGEEPGRQALQKASRKLQEGAEDTAERRERFRAVLVHVQRSLLFRPEEEERHRVGSLCLSVSLTHTHHLQRLYRRPFLTCWRSSRISRPRCVPTWIAWLASRRERTSWRQSSGRTGTFGPAGGTCR